MKKRWALSTGVIVGLAVVAVFCWPASRYGVLGFINQERFEEGRPLSYWAQALKHEDSAVREQAALILSRMSPDAREAVPQLVEALKDPSSAVRVNAAVALYKMGAEAKAYVPAFCDSLKDEIPFVRLDAAMALQKMGADAREAVPALMEAIQEKTNQPPLPFINLSVRQAAARALGRIGPEARDAVPLLTESLKQKGDEKFTMEVSRALKLIDPQAATKAGIN